MGETESRTWTIILENRRAASRPSRRPGSGATSLDADLTQERGIERRRAAHGQALLLSGIDRTLALTLGGHRPWSGSGSPNLPVARIIEEPRDRGSGASILLATTYVLEQDLEATLLVLPSGFEAEPEDRFGQCLRSACRLAQRRNRLVLLGARSDPSSPLGEWADPGDASGAAEDGGRDMEALHPVRTLSGSQALALHRRRSLLNTGIVAAKAKVIWALGWLLRPDIMRRFDMLLRVLHAIRDERAPLEHHALALSSVYRELEQTDFTFDLLARSLDSLLVLTLDGVTFADGGHGERPSVLLPGLPRRSTAGWSPRGPRGVHSPGREAPRDRSGARSEPLVYSRRPMPV